MVEKLRQKVENLPIVRKARRLSKIIVLPGFDGLPIYYVTKFFINGIQKGLIATKASSMAFKFFLALFPTVIFLLTLIPYFPIDNFQEQLLNILEDLLPATGYAFISDSVIEVVTQPDGGLLSFGF